MSAYILILYFTTFSAGAGMTLTTAEFLDKRACEVAASQAVKLAGAFTTAKYVCVAKAPTP